MDYSFVKLFLARWKSETPDFYKRIQNIAIIAGTICSVVIGVLQAHLLVLSVGITNVLTTICTLALSFIGGAGFITKTSTTDTTLVCSDHAQQAIADGKTDVVLPAPSPTSDTPIV